MVIFLPLIYILSAPGLKILRRRVGRLYYWALTLTLGAGLYVGQAKFLSGTFISLVLLIGVFDEFEEMGLSFQISGFFSTLINSLIAAGAFALWVFFTGPNWSQTVHAMVEGAVKPLSEINPLIQINSYDIMLKLPSLAIVIWMGAIYFAVLFDATMRAQLAAFRLPDACIWTLVVSLLGAFGGFTAPALEAVAANAVNVCLVLLFFQGIAVVAKFFETMRLSTLWQVLFMIVIVSQLFLFVSILGLMDYWLDFRSRMNKRAEGFNREA